MALRTALNETRQQKKQLRAIIDGACVALVVIDAQRQVLMANNAAATMLGKKAYDLGTLLGGTPAAMDRRPCCS